MRSEEGDYWTHYEEGHGECAQRKVITGLTMRKAMVNALMEA